MKENIMSFSRFGFGDRGINISKEFTLDRADVSDVFVAPTTSFSSLDLGSVFSAPTLSATATADTGFASAGSFGSATGSNSVSISGFSYAAVGNDGESFAFSEISVTTDGTTQSTSDSASSDGFSADMVTQMLLSSNVPSVQTTDFSPLFSSRMVESEYDFSFGFG